MSEFKVGDVVKLKSGGPLMTVTSKRSDNEVLATWFLNGTNGPHHNAFKIDSLKKADE